MENDYDSKYDTLSHREMVVTYLDKIANQLRERGKCHDESKLHSPEKECFDIITPKLKQSTYGSDEYRCLLKEMSFAIDHHYKVNRHHPEFFKAGLIEMNIVDLIEMICDWAAAVKRHANGSWEKSLDINKTRFELGDQLSSIIKNTFLMEDWHGRD